MILPRKCSINTGRPHTSENKRCSRQKSYSLRSIIVTQTLHNLIILGFFFGEVLKEKVLPHFHLLPVCIQPRPFVHVVVDVFHHSLIIYIMINCKNLIIGNFGLDALLFNRYLEVLSQTFHAIPESKEHKLEVASQEQFVKQVLSHPQNSGFCLAHSGVPECVELNQSQGIRAAVAHTKYIAKMCREHNDANVVIIGTDCVGEKLSGFLLQTYLESGFDNEERNMLRIQKMKQLQQKYLMK